MGEFDGLLICTDLDGTLLREDKSVSKENKEAIEYFKSEGGKFTFITGRPPIIAGDVYELVKPNAPIGCFNGGGIYDFINCKFLWSVELPKEAFELMRYVERKMPQIGYQLNTTGRIIFCKENSTMKWFREVTNIPNDACNLDDVNEPVIKVVFGSDDINEVKELAKLLNEHPEASDYDFIHSEARLYELLPKGISKGNLLIKIADILGIDRRNTIAVGDYNNDISMIKAAGIGYAVANALPEVKAVADRVTVSNEQHAIAAIVKDLDNDYRKLK